MAINKKKFKLEFKVSVDLRIRPRKAILLDTCDAVFLKSEKRQGRVIAVY